MHVSRPVVLTGTLFAVIALALPFASFPVIGAVDGIRADAWPVAAVLAPAALLAALGDWSRGSGPLAGGVALVGACAGLVFSIVKIADAVVSVRGIAGASVGPGGGVLALGTATVVTGSILALRR
jgi:hypothetical protein